MSGDQIKINGQRLNLLVSTLGVFIDFPYIKCNEFVRWKPYDVTLRPYDYAIETRGN